DENGHREADATQTTDDEDAAPGGAGGQRTPSESHGKPAREEDADRFAHDQPDEGAEHDRLRGSGMEIEPADGHARVREREQRHDAVGDPGMQRRLDANDRRQDVALSALELFDRFEQDARIRSALLGQQSLTELVQRATHERNRTLSAPERHDRRHQSENDAGERGMNADLEK